MSAEKLKSVLIIGPGHIYDKYFLWSFAGPGYLAIGDGRRSLEKQDFSILQGRVDHHTRIDIHIHGGGSHEVMLESGNYEPTYTLFSWLKECNPNMPLQIHFWSCYGGAANAYVTYLSEGSMLLNYIPLQYTQLTDLALYSLENSLSKLKKSHNKAYSPIEDFVENLSYELMQTASITTYVDGQIHELTLAPKLSDVLADPDKALKKEILKITSFADMVYKLVAVKDQNAYSNFKIAKSITKVFSEQEKKEFQQGYFVHACHSGNIKEIEQAFANTPEKSIKDLLDRSIVGLRPLFIAAQERHADVVKILIEHNADINKANYDNGATPLSISTQNDYPEIVEMLIAHGADVNKENNEMLSPLHIACYTGRLEIVKMLVGAKADLYAKTYRGTPLDLAKQQNHLEIVKLLEDVIEAEQKASVLTDNHAHELIGEYGDHEANHIYHNEL